MDLVPGRDGDLASAAARHRAVDSEAGRRLYLLDLIAGNPDRTDSNLRLNRDEPSGIDHASNFQGGTRVGQPVEPHGEDLFNDRYKGVVLDARGNPEWSADLPFTVPELRAARRALVQAGPEFRAMGREQWHANALARVDGMIKKVTAPRARKAAPEKPTITRVAAKKAGVPAVKKAVLKKAAPAAPTTRAARSRADVGDTVVWAPGGGEKPIRGKITKANSNSIYVQWEGGRLERIERKRFNTDPELSLRKAKAPVAATKKAAPAKAAPRGRQTGTRGVPGGGVNLPESIPGGGDTGLPGGPGGKAGGAGAAGEVVRAGPGTARIGDEILMTPRDQAYKPGMKATAHRIARIERTGGSGMHNRYVFYDKDDNPIGASYGTAPNGRLNIRHAAPKSTPAKTAKAVPSKKAAAPAAKKAAKAAPEKPTITREAKKIAKAAPPAEKKTPAAKKAAATEERMRRALPAVREAAKEAAAEPAGDRELRSRARGSLLDRDVRNLNNPDVVDAEMRRLTEQDRVDAERLRTAGPRPPIDESVALSRDPEGDNSIMHGDSPAMELAQALARRNRNGSANKVMEMRRDYSRNTDDIDAAQRAVDELRLMRLEETDPEIRKLYDKALGQMDAPDTGLPDLPASTPPAARQLIKDLHRIPLARRVESGNLEGRERVSAVEQLAEIYRQIDAGELQGSRGEIENKVRRVLHRYHESRDGAYPMWNLERRLDPGSDLGKELTGWVRREPLMMNRKLGPNTRGMLSEREDLFPGTPAIKRPRQLTQHEIEKLGNGQVIDAFKEDKILRAVAATELRRRALDLDTAAGRKELNEHHIGNPESMEMRRVADQLRDSANGIETGTVLRNGEKPTAQVAAERKALREAAKAKGKRIAQAQGRAAYARDLEQALDATMRDGDDDRLRAVLRERFKAKAPGQREEADGWNEIQGAIGEMLPTENREQFQERMRDVLRNHGIELDGHAGDWVSYDPNTHELLAGDTKTGNAVQVLTPGVSFIDEDGSRVELSKPVVQTKAAALKEGLVPAGGEPTQVRPRAARGVARAPASARPTTAWPEPTPSRITRDQGGALSGQLTSLQGVARMLPEDTGPEGVPVRGLEMPNGYRMPFATAWRHDGVTYLVQHRDNDASRRRATAAKEKLERFHRNLPVDAQRWQRSYALAMDANPEDIMFARRFDDPGFMSSAAAGGGHLTIWHGGSGMEMDQEGPKWLDEMRHEVGHNIASGTGAVPYWDRPSPQVAEIISRSDPRGRVAGFRPLPRELSQTMAMAIRNWGETPPPDAKGIVRNGVTPYGRMSYSENFAEAHSLYLMGIVGYDDQGNPVYFRDFFPEWAALFDQFYPEFGRRQVRVIANERTSMPSRPRITRQAPRRRLQASAVRGSHTPQYHPALL
jgi:hypothetical protein